MKKFTTIKDLSDSRRMPRLNKIRLGAKIKSSGTGKEFPVELPFFLLPDEVAAVHGGKIQDIEARAKLLGSTRKDVLKFVKENGHRLAEELPVMIPVNDISQSFPQAYKMYGGSIGLKCTGNGEDAEERVGVTPEFKSRKCPCNQLKSDKNPKGNCSIVANLQVILPEVSMGGVYQIDIGSINSIIDINSGIDYTKSIYEKATGSARVAMVPLKLKRVPTETHHGGKKQIHFTCSLTPVGTIKTFTQLAESSKLMLTHAEALALPEPDLSDPKLDPVDDIYTQPDHITEKLGDLSELATDKKLTKNEIDSVRRAVDENDESTIETIHKNITARIIKGSSADDVAGKLGKKKTEPEPKSANEQEAPEKDDRF